MLLQCFWCTRGDNRLSSRFVIQDFIRSNMKCLQEKNVDRRRTQKNSSTRTRQREARHCVCVSICVSQGVKTHVASL